jgi:hypothetical protein
MQVSMCKSARSQLKNFRSNARGAVALLTGLMLIMIAIGAGTAIDFVRGSRQRFLGVSGDESHIPATLFDGRFAANR